MLEIIITYNKNQQFDNEHSLYIKVVFHAESYYRFKWWID